jgi:YYY domain-containing protein
MRLWLVARWLLVFAALTAIGAPIAAVLFDRLPKRGAAFSLPAALIPLTILVFWIGQVSFGMGTIWLGVGIVLGLSIVAFVSGYRPNWSAVAGAYAVFALAFGLMVLFRASNPAIRPLGGEDFLHFGVMNAIMRAEALPPEDFWFAGETLRYYYGTQLGIVEFTMLTGTESRFGFNLGTAAFYGVLAVTAYGLVGSVVHAAGRSYRFGGLLGAFFVAVGGATTTTIRFLTPHLPGGVSDSVARAAFGFHAARFNGGDLTASVEALSNYESWSWWYTRYVVPGTLQEFPMYSFVKGDLHGHAMSNGYILFAAALAFAYYRTPAEDRLARVGLLFGGIGGVAGLFGFMNTWSLPTAVGLAWLGVAAADAHPATLLPDGVRARLRARFTGGFAPRDRDVLTRLPEAGTRRKRLLEETWRVVLGGVVAALVGVVGVVIASPFLVFGSVPTNEGIGVFPPRTAGGPFLVIYGGLLVLFVGFLAARVRQPFREGGPLHTAVALMTLVTCLVVALVWSFHIAIVTVPVLLAAWWLVRTDRAGFEAVLLVAGVGLLLSMDLVHAKGIAPFRRERWNTTLKVAVQGWTLSAAAAGAVGTLLLAEARDTILAWTTARKSSGTDASVAGGDDVTRRRVVSALLATGVVLAVVATSAHFAALATGKVLGDELINAGADDEIEATNVTGYQWEELSLGGLAFHERWRPTEMAAIYWLDNRSGTPTIVEAPGRSYGWMNPASTLTGIPTVVGWSHEENYRGPDAYQRRARQVDGVYVGSWANASSTLRRHDIAYVYVGPREREVYGNELRSFDRKPFTVAFENAAVTVYAVNHSELDRSP